MIRFFLAIGGAVLLPASGAVIYNAVDDFSDSVNSEGSTWSYRAASDGVRDGSYGLLGTNAEPGLWSPATPIWRGSGNYPGIAVNRTGDEIDWIGNENYFAWPDQTIWMHPPENPGFVALTWRAPEAGIVSIDFSIRDIDGNDGDGVVWYLDLNTAAGELASGSLSNGASIGGQQVNGVNVEAGDRIHLLINRKGGYIYDSTAVTATITMVPEPSSVGLLIAGVAMGLRRRRPHA